MLCTTLIALAPSLVQEPAARPVIDAPAPSWTAAGRADGQRARGGAGRSLGRGRAPESHALQSIGGCLQVDAGSEVLPVTPGFSLNASDEVLGLGNGEALVTLRSHEQGQNNYQIGVVSSQGHAGQWGPLKVLDAFQGSDGLPDTALSPNGDITLLYISSLGGNSFLWSVRFTQAAGWGSPELVHMDDEQIYGVDLVATADNDLWVAVQIASPSRVHVLSYTHATDTWGTPSPISPPGVSAVCTTIRASHSGEHLMVAYLGYVSPNSANDGIWAHAWNPDTQSWGPALQAPGSNSYFLGFSSVAVELGLEVESDGEAAIVYSTSAAGGQSSKLRANRFSNGLWEPFVDLLDLPFAGELLGREQCSALSENDVAHWVLAPRHPTLPGAYAVRTVLHDPVHGWSVGQIEPPIQVQFFQPIPVPRVQIYDGERAILTYNDNSDLQGRHFNGQAWSDEPLAVPPINVNSIVLGAAGGESLFLRDNFTILAHWLQGAYGFSTLGGGSAGALGVPALSAACDQVPGQTVQIDLDDAAPNAPAFLVVGLGRVDVPLFGSVLVPSPDFVQPAQFTDASGSASLSLPWNVNQPPGFALYYQTWVVDPTGPQGFAASNALVGVTP